MATKRNIQFRDLPRQYNQYKREIDEAISRTLHKCDFISGEAVRMLENKLADYVGIKHCITCANGTDAITLALMAWGIGRNDAVFVPDFTFFSSGECPAALGASPIFVDVDEDTYNLSSEALEERIIYVIEKTPLIPKAVIAVDLFGLPASFSKIRQICDKYDLLLLEDGAQGFGGKIGKNVACSFGDISTTSFFPAKPLGCYGDGGAIFTDNAQWAQLLSSLAVHGKGSTKYDNERLGLNSRLDTIQAAILQVKLQAFEERELKAVNCVAEWYAEELKDSCLKLPKIAKNYISSWAQYTVQLPERVCRQDVQKALKEKGIPTMIYYKKPMHSQLAFKETESAIANSPVTEKICNRVLSLPMHPYLEREIVFDISKEILKLL